MHEIIDSHCHLDLPAFDPDRDEVIARAREAGVIAFVVPGTTAGGWEKLLRITADSDCLYPALGLHPYFMEAHRAEDLTTLAALCRERRPVAIGEIGLDFQLEKFDAGAQEALLKAQLRLAAELDLPVILHVRKAHDAMLKALRQSGVKGGICHAFNGSLQQAQQYMKLGFLFGFGGMLTYPNARRLQRLARELPLDHIVLETDAPDMAGALHHGERNSPEYLPEVLDALTRLREEPAAGVARQTTENVRRLLKLT
ncbi:MAG: TatD family deoxyribonuclease [Gammaproteobacteria bacterium]|nr:MAG: TatD family deoxyribonuclease [Gammaproteobacteria bacterium]RTZ72612.1 MAG: TatD family deoxyribonuclease [Gammaproteobacteria bacterium]